MVSSARQFGGGFIAPSVLAHLKAQTPVPAVAPRQLGGGYIAPSVLAHLRKVG
jgi:hypothetical protein